MNISKSIIIVILISGTIGAIANAPSSPRHVVITTATAGQVPLDTMKYLQQHIIDRKGMYLNKDLNILLGDLTLKVRSYNIEPGRDSRILPGVNLFFVDKDTAVRIIRRREKITMLLIEWATPPPLDSAIAVLRKGKGNWLTSEKNFYGPMIIKDIKLFGK